MTHVKATITALMSDSSLGNKLIQCLIEDGLLGDRILYQIMARHIDILDTVYPCITKVGDLWVATDDTLFIIARLDRFLVTMVHLGSGATFTPVTVKNITSIRVNEFQELISQTYAPDITAWRLATPNEYTITMLQNDE
jgi:hypothetical protein